MKKTQFLFSFVIASTFAANFVNANQPANAPTQPAPATQPAVNSAELAPLIDKAIAELSASTPIDANAAQIKLSMISLDALPLLEAAARKPGIPPEAQARLNKIIARDREWVVPHKRIDAQLIAGAKENIDTALAAYDRASTKDPKWDADARKAIELYVTPRDRVTNEQARAALEKAINEGCNDPLALYFEARTIDPSTPAQREAVSQLFDRASKGFENSKYPPTRKIYCYLRDFDMKRAVFHDKNPAWDKPIVGPAGAAIDHLARLTADTVPAVAEEKLSGTRLIDFAQDVIDTMWPNRKLMFDRLYPPLEKMSPDDSSILTIKGDFYIKYAWDARGGGWANTVTDDGWKKMRERLDIAADALTKAWEKDHDNARAARLMIAVELGQGQGRNRMEMWFNRARKADPSDRSTYEAKLNYLEPKWFGTSEDMIVFGRQCVEEGNWLDGIPFLLIDAHIRLAAYAPSPQQYYSQPQVWRDLQSIYVPYLQAEPDDTYTRSCYCFLACQAGNWSVAKKQFDLLGDDADVGRFGGVEELTRFREQAKQQTGTPSAP